MDEKMQFNLRQNPQHGFLEVFPPPSTEQVEKYYREEFYSTNYGKINDSGHDEQLRNKAYNDLWTEYIFERIAAFFPRSKKNFSIFDIGCGYGQKLEYFQKKGWNSFGVDPSPEAVKYCNDLGINVNLGQISDFKNIQNGPFDVVTLFNVLEHLTSPDEVLRDISCSLVAENSIIVIDIPNDFSRLQEIAKLEIGAKKDWWFAAPAHVNYFNFKSLISVLESAGFVLLDYWSSFPMEFFLLMGDNYTVNSSVGRTCHDKRVAFENSFFQSGNAEYLVSLYRNFAKLGMGRQLTVIAKKSGSNNQE